MDAETHWSAEECSWLPAGAPAGLYWSVQRCRWEPVGAGTDALVTAWAMFQEAQAEVAVPQPRAAQKAPVTA